MFKHKKTLMNRNWSHFSFIWKRAKLFSHLNHILVNVHKAPTVFFTYMQCHYWSFTHFVSSLFIFICFNSVVPGIFGDQQTHYLDVIKQMLAQSLATTDIPSVCFEAVKATTAFLTINEGEASIVFHFRDLLPGVIQVFL